LTAALAVWVGLVLCAGAQELPGWTLVWADEFNQANGTAPDATKWRYDTGGGGWGNNELQTYTSRTNNCRIENGCLVIEARKETFTGSDGITRNYTSARLKTQGRAAWTYGRIEARIQVPRGQGIWPAFWMLGEDISTVGWPACGEIDIMENIGRETNIVHGTVHGPGYSGGNGIGGAYTLPGGGAVADDFHVFAIEWRTNLIRWLVDGVGYFSVTPAALPAGTRWVFDHPHFLLLNVAVGGNWPGNPDASTVFPQRMLVDYVRVYVPAAPVIENIQPDGATPFVTPTNQLRFNIRSPGAGVPPGGVRVLLNGVDISPRLTLTGSSTNRTVSFSGLTSNVVYAVSATATDLNGLATTATWQFDTFSPDNFMWEAEDFDFGGGQFLDDPLPSSLPSANSYYGRVGLADIDRRETSYDGDRLYRPGDAMATLVANDFLRPKFQAAIAAGDPNVKDYKLGYFYNGEWANYTRTFPTGQFRVYARLAGGSGQTELYLDRVVAGRGTASQTTARLGSFRFTGRGWQAFDFVPLCDNNGAWVTVALAGVTTLRATTAGGNDPNYFMLVPTGLPLPVAIHRVGCLAYLRFPTFAGVEHGVLCKDDLGDAAWQVWQTVWGDGTPAQLPITPAGHRRFFCVIRRRAWPLAIPRRLPV